MPKPTLLESLPEVFYLIRKSRHPIKLVWIGLDSVGKSSLIKRLKTGEFYEGSMPRTMGMSVDKLFYEADSNFEIISFDLGGQIYFRENLWHDYLRGASAIIYILDISDQNRFDESKRELWEYAFSKNNDEQTPVLILANKSDKTDAINHEELKKKLELDKAQNRNVSLFLVSALTGLNLEKSFIWLFKALLSQNEKKKKQ